MKRRGFLQALGGLSVAGVGGALVTTPGLPADDAIRSLRGGALIVHPNDALLVPSDVHVPLVTDWECPPMQAYHIDGPSLEEFESVLRATYGDRPSLPPPPPLWSKLPKHPESGR